MNEVVGVNIDASQYDAIDVYATVNYDPNMKNYFYSQVPFMPMLWMTGTYRCTILHFIPSQWSFIFSLSSKDEIMMKSMQLFENVM